MAPHFPTLRRDRPTDEQRVWASELCLGSPSPPGLGAPPCAVGPPLRGRPPVTPAQPTLTRNPVLVSFQVDPVFTREVKAGVRR